ILKPFYAMGRSVYGYIRLESQMENSHRKDFRDHNDHISRKPLKCRDEISPENNRIIPITDKLTWEILVKYRHLASADYMNRTLVSNDPNDYLLFNLYLQDITKEIFK